MRTLLWIVAMPVHVWTYSRPSCSWCRYLDEDDVERVGGFWPRVRLAFVMWRAGL